MVLFDPQRHKSHTHKKRGGEEYKKLLHLNNNKLSYEMGRTVMKKISQISSSCYYSSMRQQMSGTSQLRFYSYPVQSKHSRNATSTFTVTKIKWRIFFTESGNIINQIELLNKPIYNSYECTSFFRLKNSHNF